MKLTKTQLKAIIKEEITSLREQSSTVQIALTVDDLYIISEALDREYLASDLGDDWPGVVEAKAAYAKINAALDAAGE